MNEITVVGCGSMGSALIRAFMDFGLEVTIVNRTKSKAEQFVAEGAHYAESLDILNDEEMSRCILFNLATQDIVEDVIKSLNPAKLKDKIVINTTTCTPEESRNMKKLIEGVGGHFINAALEVYPNEIGPETGYVVYSGCKEVFEYTEPALKAIGKAIYLGEDVAGASVVDLAVLQVHFAAIAGLGEAMAYCLKNDYSPLAFSEQVRDILPIMMEGNFRSFGKELENYTGVFEPAVDCSILIETQNTKMIRDEMNKLGIKTPVSDSVVELFEDSIKNGNSDKDIVAIVNELL